MRNKYPMSKTRKLSSWSGDDHDRISLITLRGFYHFVSTPFQNDKFNGKFSPWRAGSTIIEMLIYMGILTVLLSVLMVMFSSIIGVQLESKATSSVDQDSRYILARLAYDMQSATEIASPSAGMTDSTLKIQVNSIDYIYSLSGTNLQITDNNDTNVLNSTDTNISDVSFRRIGNGDDDDTIRISFTVTSKTRKITGTQYETKTFTTTLGRHTL